MEPLEIKIDLMRAGVTMADIGRRCGVTRQAVSLVVSGSMRSAAVESAIAGALGRDAADLFPPKMKRKDINTLIKTGNNVN